MSRPGFLRSALLVGAAVLSGFGLTACGSSDGDSRHMLTKAEQAEVIDANSTKSDKVVDQIVKAGLQPRWTSAVKIHDGDDTVYSLTFTPCLKKTSDGKPDCANEIASPEHPHVVMNLDAEPTEFSRLAYRQTDTIIDGEDYYCTVVDPNKLTSEAIKGLPAELKDAPKGSPTVVIGGTRLICTVRR